MSGKPVLTLTVDVDRIERLLPDADGVPGEIDFEGRPGDRLVAYVVREHADGTADAPVVVINGWADDGDLGGLRIAALT